MYKDTPQNPLCWAPAVTPKVRLLFHKLGKAAFMSHLDLISTLQRSMRRAGLCVGYSSGFNPHVILSVLLPLSTGFESVCELCDFELEGEAAPEDVIERLNAALPEGLQAIRLYTPQMPASEIAFARFEIFFSDAKQLALPQDATVEKRSKRGQKQVKLMDYIKEIHFQETPGGTVCDCVLAAGGDPLNPVYITKALVSAGLLADETVASYKRCEILIENGETFA